MNSDSEKYYYSRCYSLLESQVLENHFCLATIRKVTINKINISI